MDLQAASGTATVYELAANAAITTSTPTSISTPSGYPAVIEAPGPSVLAVSSNTNLWISDRRDLQQRDHYRPGILRHPEQ